MTYQNLLVEQDGAVALVAVNRPRKLNALNAATIAELAAAMAALAAGGARAIVRHGRSAKAFVAGADIEELTGLTPAAARCTRQPDSAPSTPSSGSACRSSPPSTASRSAAAANWPWLHAPPRG
ncbi:MAG: enoyl-CoA hydratase-related protein [Vicinamibacterales bacterium]